MEAVLSWSVLLRLRIAQTRACTKKIRFEPKADQIPPIVKSSKLEVKRPIVPHAVEPTSLSRDCNPVSRRVFLTAPITSVFKQVVYPMGLLPAHPPHPRGLRPRAPRRLGELRSGNTLHLEGCASKPLHLRAAPSNPYSGFAP